MGHVMLYSFHEYDNIIWKFINAVNMAMFMFVSGCFVGNPKWVHMLKKIKTLLIPCISVGLLYTFVKGYDLPSFFINSLHYGYWFCLTLFMYHLFYVLISKLICFLGFSKVKVKCVLLWAAVIMLLVISRYVVYDNVLVKSFSLQPFFKFLPYFAYGLTINNIPQLGKTIEKDNIIFTASLLFLFIFTFLGLNQTINQLIVAFCYINVMIYFFNRICINRKNKAIEYVAKRSLDIYLFHFFLLPSFFVAIPVNFNPDNNILLTLFVIGAISLIVLAGTLILTKFIEYSRLFSLIMLGKTTKMTNNPI